MNVWSLSFLVFIYFFFCTNHASLEIVAGGYHNCVYEPGQTGMLCWGRNSDGQLGYEDTNNRGDDAGEMSANLPIVNLGPNFLVNTTSLGNYHSCAASQEHAVKCWGRGNRYQTGHATNNDLGNATGQMGVNLAFVEFRVDFVPLKVAGGGWHSCVLSTDALLVCFGYNSAGQCGTGTSESPVIGPPSNIADVDLGSDFTPIDIAAFGNHVCAISQQQTMKCFGWNPYGQLGYGDTTARGLTPQSMGDGLSVLSLGSNFTPKAVAVGNYHTCALSTLKTVKCFGSNNYGQCGQVTPGGSNNNIGDAANEMDDNLPVIVFPDGFVPMQMALGYRHTCILSESAQVVCFGRNTYGQLGLGHTSSTTSPTLVDLGTGFIPRKLTAGAFHTCAVSAVDTVKCWGRNGDGQLGLGHSNNKGDSPNEMGDDLPIVDVCLGVCTAAPTSAAPTTAAPTTATPSTAAPTTATPTTTGPTTATPTTITTTAESETTHAPNNSNHTVTVTIRTNSLSSSQVLVAIANAHNLSPTLLTITTLSSEDESDDGFATVELLVAVPSNVELDYDVIKATLREAMVDEYGEDVQVDIDVHGDGDEGDVQSPKTSAWSWGIPVAVSLGVCVCVCCVAGAIRGIYVRRQRRLSENVAKAQLEEEAQQARNDHEIGNDAEVRVVPSGVVAYARENAHVEDTRGEDNLSLPAQESVLSVGARRRGNIELAFAEVRVVPSGVFAHARENAHVEDTRGEDNVSLPAQESVLCVDEEGIAAHNQERRQSQQQQHGGDAATLQAAMATSGATAGIDPSLGVYELNLMVDL